MRNPITHVKQITGQALLEMAIILPLLLLLVLGIFEFGRAMYIQNTLTHSARAGARAAVVTPGITAASSVPPDPTCNYGDTPTGNAVIYQAVCKSLYSGIRKNTVSINVTLDPTVASPPGDFGTGDMVRVEVLINNYRSTYRIVPFIPVPSILAGNTAMRYE